MATAPPKHPLALTRADLPPLYDRADNEADRWKLRFLRLFRAQIGLLYFGAITGAASRYGATDLMTLVSLLCFLVVAGLRLYQRYSTTSDRWPAARWVAERTRSLVWSYSIGAAPFTPGSPAPDEDRRRFENALQDVVDGWRWADERLRLKEQITPAMERLRAATPAERATAYLRDRLQAQASWYETESRANAVRGKRWDLAFAVISVAAIAGGVLQLAGWLQFDLLRLAGFAAALIVSWTGLNRHRRLAKTYRSTSRELRLLAGEAPEAEDHSEWSHFVQRVETTIRREEAGWFEARS